MNEVAYREQNNYRQKREEICYSIMDIEEYYKAIAKRGLIWILKDMQDLCEAERILIDYYLVQERENQIYDDLSLNQINLSTDKTPESTNQLPLNKTFYNKDIKTNLRPQIPVYDINQYDAYNLAGELEKQVFEICRTMPSFEKKHIIDQLERSVSSIRERIAKGEQQYVGEKFNQYSIAIGSAKETTAWLQICLGQTYITQIQFNLLDESITDIVSRLTRKLVNLKNEFGELHELPNPYTQDVKRYRAYNLALQLVEKIYKITNQRQFWSEKLLQIGMRQNATTVVANIAEANQLYVKKKFVFYNQALEGLMGLKSQLDSSFNKKLIKNQEVEDINQSISIIEKIIKVTLKNKRLAYNREKEYDQRKSS